MRQLILAVILLLAAEGAYSQLNLQAETEYLKKVDTEFSDLSKAKGMKEAFLAYAAGDAVLLRPFNMPIEGYDDVKKFLEEGDGNFTLTWVPVFADVSTSGDMGYTYGIYDFTYKDEQGVEKISKGTYVSIWKKDGSGNWKFTLDTGNPGLEPKKP